MTPEPAVATERKRLNLGCGLKSYPKDLGWVNLDWTPGEGVDVVHDMTKFPWPFEDGTFDIVLASHILEHLPPVEVPYGSRKIDAFYAVCNEVWRVLKPGGAFEVEVPTVGGNGAFQDQTHRRFFVPEVWDYVSRPVTKVPNTDAARNGVIELAQLGCYSAPMRILTGRKELTVEDHRMMAQRILAELDLNAKRLEDAPAHDWSWYNADYGITCRFDCLVNIVDSTRLRYNFVILRKPTEEG